MHLAQMYKLKDGIIMHQLGLVVNQMIRVKLVKLYIHVTYM